MTLYEDTFTEMVSDTFVICKQIKRIRAKKNIDAKKQNPPRYIAFDVFSSMHFHAADIFFDVTDDRILTERIIEKMVTTLHGIVKYFVCVLQKVNDFEFT